MKLSFKNSIFEKEKHYHLETNKIIVKNKEDKIIESYSLKEVQLINLLSIPAFKGNPASFQCRVHFKGNQSIKLLSTSIESIGEHILNEEAYKDFVNALHDKLHGQEIKYVAGATKGLSTFLKIFIPFAVIAFAIIAVFAFLDGKLHVGFMMILGLLTTYHFGNSFIKAYTPKEYNPEDIPSEYLP